MYSKIGLSTWSYLSLEPFRALEKIYCLGFRAVQLWGDYPHFWPRHFLKKNNLKKLKTAIKKFTGINSIHAPIVNLIDKNMGLREEAFLQARQTIRLAALLNIKYVTLHGGGKFPGMQGWLYEKTSFDILINYLNTLCKYAEKHNIYLCLENVPDEFGFTYNEMLKILNKISSKNISVTFDTGHGNLNGNNMSRFFDKLKSKIQIIHINDNLGADDEHMPIGYGNIKFCEFFNKNLTILKNKQIIGEFSFNKKKPDFASKAFLNFIKSFNLS